MSRLIHRLYSTTTSTTNVHPSAQAAASQFLSHALASPPKPRTQLLDSNQLSLLSATLNRPADSPFHPPSSASSSLPATPSKALPPGHHLVYFTPSQVTSTLSTDGTDTSYNAPAPFTRRMWAGGEVEWVRGNALRVGQTVTETTHVRSAEGKRTRGGEEMVVVGVEKVFENGEGVAVIDKRNWVFRPTLTSPPPLPNGPLPIPFPAPPPGTHTRDITQTPVSLFRFSALTFNGHKIHYNREWCRNVEGHRELVVHGPLNLIHMLDFWRDVRSGTRNAEVGALGKGGAAGDVLLPRRVQYRALAPVYAGETYRIVMLEEVDGISEVGIWDGFGNKCMTAKIESF